MDAHSTPAETPPPDRVRGSAVNIARLLDLEDHIGTHEQNGLRARWDFGRELVAHREGKKLPKGMLAQVMTEVRVSRQDLQARMKFASRYPDEAAFSDAVRQHPTWHAMVRNGLTVKRQDAPTTTRKGDKLLDALAELNPEDVTDPVEFGRRLIEQGKRFMSARELRAA